MHPLHSGDAVVAELAVLTTLQTERDALERPNHGAAEAALVRVEGAEWLDRPVAEVKAHRRNVAADAEVGIDADRAAAVVVLLWLQRQPVAMEKAEDLVDGWRYIDLATHRPRLRTS